MYSIYPSTWDEAIEGMLKFTEHINVGGRASRLSERVGIKEVLMDWEVSCYSLLFNKPPQSLVALNYGNIILLIRLPHGQSLAWTAHLCTTGLSWRGSKARSWSHVKSPSFIWWWMLALGGPRVERPRVDFMCCCLASSQLGGWVGSQCKIQRKIAREGVAKALSYFMTKSQKPDSVTSVFCGFEVKRPVYV